MRIPRWLIWLFVAAALTICVRALWSGLWAAAAAAGLAAAVMTLIGVQMSGPTPHTPWSPDLVRPGHAVVFWKDGCPYCHRLLRAMAGDERVTWVNVYKDKAADREVRRHNGGDQLTPTALVGEQVLINPSATELRAALDQPR